MDPETYLETEADGKGASGPAVAAILESLTSVLRDAPENRRYDFDLTIEETRIGEVSE